MPLTTRATTTPMTRTDALATIAFCLLSTRGQTDKPTMHDIMLAVVQAAPLLDITGDPNATTLTLEAADNLIRRHKWDVGKVVLLNSGFAPANGHKHKPRRKTTTARPDEGASR